MALKCIELGYEMVVINYRGMAGIPIRTAKMYNAADCDDVIEVIDYIKQEYCMEGTTQVRRLVGVGISMGSSILGIYAAKMGDANPLDAHVGIGCHFEHKKAFSFLRNYMFGANDFLLGLGVIVTAGQSFE